MNVYHKIAIDSGVKYYALGEKSLNLKFGDACVISKGFYQDFGHVFKILAPDEQPPVMLKDKMNTTVISGQDTEPPTILRKANETDKAMDEVNQKRQREVLGVTQGFVEKLGLKMKLVNAHFSLDGRFLSIQFTSDGRVDFRELVKLLCQQYSAKIELKQIGVKDEAAIIGGIASCGRQVCCASFLTEFPNVSTKMVKEQDLAPGSQNTSGICGRIKCCMKYEYEGYLEMDKGMPRRGDYCECKDGPGKIVDRNLLTGKVTIQLSETKRHVTCDRSEVSPYTPPEQQLQNTARDGKDANAKQQERTQHNNAPKGNPKQGK